MLSVLLLPLAASLLASVACGAVGTLCVARHNTYVAGAVSHASFAGIGLARWLAATHGCAWATETLGALAAALAAALFLALSPAARGARSDGALSAIWAVGMAAGLLFLAATPGYQGDLSSALFGSVLFVSRGDLAWMAGFDAALLAVLLVFRRGILAVSFNERLAAMRGGPVRLWSCALSVATALSVVLLVRVAGIVLTVAMLALPALAARPFARRLVPMMALAGAFSFAALAAGLALSWRFDCQPSAPTVLLAAAAAAAAPRLARLAGRNRRRQTPGR